jgi:dihydrofolate reductase
MGKIVSNFFIALDGVVEAPNEWHFPYFDDDMGAAVGRGMEETEAFLMGRRLYEEWSDYWPKQGDDVPFSGFINAIPKYVLSTTLTDASWQNTTILRNVDDVRRVKQETARTIGISGSAATVRSLLASGLLDELHLLVHPIAVGHGQRLFEDTPTHSLRLLRGEVFGSGVLDLEYAPAEQE